ncbi:unnamed protein product, partial [Owenia fusiformis]
IPPEKRKATDIDDNAAAAIPNKRQKTLLCEVEKENAELKRENVYLLDSIRFRNHQLEDERESKKKLCLQLERYQLEDERRKKEREWPESHDVLTGMKEERDGVLSLFEEKKAINKADESNFLMKQHNKKEGWRLKKERERLKRKENGLDERENDLDERENGLDEREKELIEMKKIIQEQFAYIKQANTPKMQYIIQQKEEREENMIQRMGEMQQENNSLRDMLCEIQHLSGCCI